MARLSAESARSSTTRMRGRLFLHMIALVLIVRGCSTLFRPHLVSMKARVCQEEEVAGRLGNVGKMRVVKLLTVQGNPLQRKAVGPQRAPTETSPVPILSRLLEPPALQSVTHEV